MANEVVFVVEDSPEGDYTAYALSHSIVTEADTLNELHAMVRDAVLCYFDEGMEPSNHPLALCS